MKIRLTMGANVFRQVTTSQAEWENFDLQPRHLAEALSRSHIPEYIWNRLYG
jgi:hypothetical protein